MWLTNVTSFQSLVRSDHDPVRFERNLLIDQWRARAPTRLVPRTRRVPSSPDKILLAAYHFSLHSVCMLNRNITRYVNCCFRFGKWNSVEKEGKERKGRNKEGRRKGKNRMGKNRIVHCSRIRLSHLSTYTSRRDSGRRKFCTFFCAGRLVGEGRQWYLTCLSAQFRDFIRKRRR